MKSSINGRLLKAALTPLFQRLLLPPVKSYSDKDKYIISSDSSFAPFVFQDDSNQYTGIDMELIKAMPKTKALLWK